MTDVTPITISSKELSNVSVSLPERESFGYDQFEHWVKLRPSQNIDWFVSENHEKKVFFLIWGN